MDIKRAVVNTEVQLFVNVLKKKKKTPGTSKDFVKLMSNLWVWNVGILLLAYVQVEIFLASSC